MSLLQRVAQSTGWACSVQSANLTNLQIGRDNLPIGKLASQFTTCTEQSANYLDICLICKSCQPISFYIMKTNIGGRQQFKILTIAITGKFLSLIYFEVVTVNVSFMSQFNINIEY